MINKINQTREFPTPAMPFYACELEPIQHTNWDLGVCSIDRRSDKMAFTRAEYGRIWTNKPTCFTLFSRMNDLKNQSTLWIHWLIDDPLVLNTVILKPCKTISSAAQKMTYNRVFVWADVSVLERNIQTWHMKKKKNQLKIGRSVYYCECTHITQIATDKNNPK